MHALLSAAFLTAQGGLGAAPSPQLLFTLARTTNANVVEYAARMQPDGLLDRGHPLDVSWKMLAQDGRREGLNFFEQQFAYGISSRTLVDREVYEVRLVSCADRPIVVRRVGGGFEAETRIGGIPSRLMRIFVHTSEGGMGPKVLDVELTGTSLRDGRPTFERIAPQSPEQ